MDVLGIGPMELLLILIVALMVFGPDKLPQIGAKLGKGMRDMRKATRAISEEINSTRAAIENPARELAEPFKDVAGAAKAAGAVMTAARNPGAAIRDSVLKELNSPVQPEAAKSEENTIAPPALLAPAALPAPEQPVATLPPPEEPIAQLPAAAESLADAPQEATPLVAPNLAETEPQLDDEPPAAEPDTPSPTRTPPEQ